jgi:hypothetical protein
MMPFDTAACARRYAQAPGPITSTGSPAPDGMTVDLFIYGGEPELPGVVDTRIGHQQLVCLLDSQCLIVDQDLDELTPEASIHVKAKVMETNLTMLTDLPRKLTEPEDASEAARLDYPSLGIA